MPSQQSSSSINANQPKRGRDATPTSGGSPSDCSSGTNTSPSSSDRGKAPGQKRRRRAPSPSHWIPATLRNFNLMSPETVQRTMPVPLPPVRRNLAKGEERDSYDENVAVNPYHPSGWNGVLPGPGLPHHSGLSVKDVRNLNQGGRGSYTVGRVMRVF